MYEKITLPDAIRRSCLTTRFAGEEILGHRMTIAEHHYEVATYVMYVIDCLNKDNPELISDAAALASIRLALVHDMPEIITGDIPTPAKYAIERFKTVLDELEEMVITTVMPDHVAEQFALVDASNDNVVANIVVKCADIMAVTREIVDERQRGNNIGQGMKFVNEAITRLSKKYDIGGDGASTFEADVLGGCCRIIDNFIGQVYI